MPGCFICTWLARWKISRSFSQSEKCRLTQVYEWMDYQLFNLGNVSWKHYPVSRRRVTLSVTHPKESLRLGHILTMCFWVNWPRSTQRSQQFTLNPTLLIRRQCGSDPHDQQRSPNLRHVTRTRRVDLDGLFERVTFGSFQCDEIHANNTSTGG